MLYCPKCQQTYEEGGQRFCLNEGERLLHVNSAGQTSNQPSSVFTNILNRKTGDDDGGKFSTVPKFSPSDVSGYSRPKFQPTENSSFFKSETEIQLEMEREPRTAFKPTFADFSLPAPGSKTFAEPISEEESPIVEVGEESIIETDAVEIIAEPDATPEELVKNRYRTAEIIAENDDSVDYSAEDTLENGKKVSLRIWKDGNVEDFFANEILAEERKSLARINHPNFANALDAGKTADGKSFIVTEFTAGKTVREILETNGQLNALRTARIIRQAADALGEAHQNGVLHRNLKAEDIILFQDENGAERVKVTNFGAAQEKLNEENLLYKSPEQVEGKIANVASDNYSLAVVAYQMLTNRLPFNALSVGELLKSQREGLRMRPSDVRFDLPSLVDGILKKALAFNSFDRYSRARDFGDEFFSEIIANAPLEADEEETFAGSSEAETAALPDDSADENSADEILTTAVAPEVFVPEFRVADKAESRDVKAADDLAWEKRSPEPPNEARRHSGNVWSVVGIAVLLAALLGVWYYFINRPNEALAPVVTEVPVQNQPATDNAPLNAVNTPTAPPPAELESPPPARSIKQPAGSVYFQNSRDNLTGEKMKNFLGFSLYYPQDWKIGTAESSFLDVSRKAANNLPVEQMLVSYYSSQGTFKSDAEIFPVEVKKTDATLKKIIPNYKLISQGEKTVNNGWQAYEVKFEGKSKTAGGEDISIWGRRLFIPTQLRGMNNGYVITMLATSLSKEVKSVDDVGVKGELSSVLETFEPNQNF